MKRFLVLVFIALTAACHIAMAQGNIEKMQPVLSLEHITVLSSPTEGWAAVANDQSRTILAYGDQALMADDLSPEFRWMMEQYDQSQSASQTLATRHQRRAESQVVPVLVSSRWGQGYPFYNACPKDQATGYICKTGCVATATAQVLYYHRKEGEKVGKQYMSELIGSKRYVFTDSKKNHVAIALNFGNTVLDWANMTDTYVSNTEAERKAVSKLMFVCGVAASMIYGPNVSLSDPSVCAAGINAAFKGMTARMADFSEDLIRDEIIAGRPVIYSGNDGNGNAHAFVLDGIDANGKIHCNMGYNGSGDGYYSITNLGNFPNPQNLLLIAPTDSDKPSISPVADINGNYYAQASQTPATSINTNQWYVLWNSGRSGAPMSSGVGATIINASIMPGNEPARYTAAQMVRFVARPAGGYYIQTGRGDYLGNFSASQGATASTTSSPSAWFDVEQIKSGYFALKTMGVRYLDTNGPGQSVVGWNTQAPTDEFSNSAWQIFPVNMQAAAFEKEDNGGSVVTDAYFSADKIYTLRNHGASGSSEGYLVAINSSDANPTLRSATRAVGGGGIKSEYQQDYDIYNRGSYWRLEPSGSNATRWYLKNELTGKYLGGSGAASAAPYTFKGKTTLEVTKRADGTYAFRDAAAVSVSTAYLCASTHTSLSNPAAFWEISDAGSYWTVEEVERIPIRTIDGSQFSSTSKYTIANATGAGYLVTTSSTDAEPTLRGATTADALSQFKEEVDLSDLGSFWTITHDASGIYVQNCLTGTYLTNEGDRTNYRLSAIKVPLKMGQHEGQTTYWFNSMSVDDVSFLCGRPYQDAAMSYGYKDDGGSKWTITAANPIAKILPTEITLNKTQVMLAIGGTSQLTATVNPSTATSKSVQWTSSDDAVATVSATGEITALTAGTIEITATSKAAPDVYATCVVVVFSGGDTEEVTSRPADGWVSGTQYQIYNRATGKYLVAAKVAAGDSYSVSFSKTAAHTNGGRKASAIKLGDQSISVEPNKTYQDLTDHTFTIEPGATVKPAFIWTGSWMHGYVFIDKDSSDRQFTVSELVSAAGKPSPEANVDLATAMPSFRVPDSPGRYRMRYLVDWDSTNPQGSSTLITNGGYIIDVTLVVGTPEELPETDDDSYVWSLTTATTAELSDPSTFWELQAGSQSGTLTLKNVAANKYLTEPAKNAVYTLGSDPNDLSILSLSGGLQIRDYDFGNSYITATNLSGVSTMTANDIWVFKKISGISFESYITQSQINQAKALLGRKGSVGYPATVDPSISTLSTLVNKADATTTVTTSAYRTALNAYLSAPVVMPQTGRAYRVSAVHVNASGTVTDRYYLYADADGNICAAPDAPASQPISRFIARETSAGKYALVNEQGRYLTWVSGGSGTTEEYEALHNNIRVVSASTTIDRTSGATNVTALQKFGRFQLWTNAPSATAEDQDRRFFIYNPTNTFQRGFVMKANSEKSYATGGDTYLFEFEEDETYTYTTLNLRKVDENEAPAYGTIYLPYAMTVPADVKAYGVEEEYSVDETCYLRLVKAGDPGSSIPAGAYIFYSDQVSGGTDVMPDLTNPTLDIDNHLFGSTLPATNLPTDGGLYVLSGKSGVGFYLYTGSEYPLGKAIYRAPVGASVAAYRFSFDEDDDDLTSVVTALGGTVAGTQTYDLAGRKVSVESAAPSQRGIYITAGRKMIR